MIPEQDSLSAYIRVSQFLADLPVDANPFEETRRILKSALGAAHVCFFSSMREYSDALECYHGCSHQGSCPLPKLFQPETMEVSESQFISTLVLSADEHDFEGTSLSTLFVPIPVKHHAPCILSVAYEGEETFRKSILDIYLGVAGILATTLDRVAFEADRLASLAARRKTLEELASAEANVRARNTFFAGISHDVRAPVAAMESLAGLLLDEHPRPDQRTSLESIRSSARNVLELLSDILEFSRLEVGKLEIQSVPFDPVDLASELIALFGEQARRKSLYLQLDTERADPGPYRGDPLRIRQILMNLLTNALKFTPEGGVLVRVEVEPVAEERARLLLEVADTGIGIPREKLEDMFGTYSQMNSGASVEEGGCGLGLAISKALVERMEGTLRVASTPGEGSTFRITLPVEPAPPEKPEFRDEPLWEEERDPPPSRPLHVLVVDDMESNLRVADAILKRLGHHTTLTREPFEAMDLLEAHQVDVMWVDLEMPGLDGNELTRRIRDRPEYSSRNLPIFGVTAHTDSETLSTCIQSGMQGCLSKPIHPKTVANLLQPFRKPPSG